MPKASWILSLRRFFTLLTPRSLALLAPLVILALSFSPLPGTEAIEIKLGGMGFRLYVGRA